MGSVGSDASSQRRGAVDDIHFTSPSKVVVSVDEVWGNFCAGILRLGGVTSRQNSRRWDFCPMAVVAALGQLQGLYLVLCRNTLLL